MFDYILFDLDGTLTDPKEGITKCVAYALSYFGIEEDPNKLIEFIGPPLAESFEKYYGFSNEDAKRAVEIYRERFNPIGKFENRVLDGVVNMLETLKAQGKILAVASSKPEVFVKQILDKFELSKYFTAVVGSELDGTRVDKAEVIKEAFLRLKLTEEQKKNTIMVGDRLHDVIGAEKNGIKCVGVEFGYAKENELIDAGANYICDTVEEALQILQF